MKFVKHERTPEYQLGLNDAQNRGTESYQEKIAKIKSEKMKNENLRNQHKWKLNMLSDKVKMAIHMNSNYEQKRLGEQYKVHDIPRQR